MDVLTPAQRSRLMARIGPKDTAPEMAVRRAAHALGYRFRLHRRDLPGTPDLVFPSRRAVVLVHGCFWHRHGAAGCRAGRASPGTRPEFWAAKFEANVRRDRRTAARLRALGWRVLVVWECHTRPSAREAMVARLARFLAGPRTGAAPRWCGPAPRRTAA
jgi:DNA mismatch endonuclease (patch repair protein)